jgi:ribonuclease P protein component
MHLQLVKPGWDVVFIARREAVTADYHQLEKAVTKLLTQAQLLQRGNETTSAKVN